MSCRPQAAVAGKSGSKDAKDAKASKGGDSYGADTYSTGSDYASASASYGYAAPTVSARWHSCLRCCTALPQQAPPACCTDLAAQPALPTDGMHCLPGHSERGRAVFELAGCLPG